MTDLERYKELFKSTLLEFKETTFKVKELDRFEERNGVVENTGEVIKLNVAVYKDLDYTGLEVVGGDGHATFTFDENQKFISFYATGGDY